MPTRKIMRIIHDSRPEVGIFEVVDGVFFYDSTVCDPLYAVSNTVDGGQFFHRDLLKNQAYVDPRVSEGSKEKIAKGGFSNWRAFPRGRVYYKVDEDKYYVTMHPSLNTREIRQKIGESFHLPPDKIAWTTDEEYSSLTQDSFVPLWYQGFEIRRYPEHVEAWEKGSCFLSGDNWLELKADLDQEIKEREALKTPVPKANKKPDFFYGVPKASKVKDYDWGFALVKSAYWKAHGEDSFVERHVATANEAFEIQRSLGEHDGIAFEVIECSPNSWRRVI